MDSPVPALVFGLCLIVLGGWMISAQRKAAQRIDEQSDNPRQERFLHRRTRRRSQVGGMILLMGVMIPVGDALIPWQKAPTTFFVYWVIVLGLAFWTILLALGDLAASRANMTQELNQLHRSQLELRDLARRLEKNQNE